MFGKKEGKKNAAPDGLSLAPGVSVLETEKGTVLFDGRQGRYFQLNELGLIVVRSLEEGKDADAIVRRVVEVYDVDAKTADADVRAFLAQIKELGVAMSQAYSPCERLRAPMVGGGRERLVEHAIAKCRETGEPAAERGRAACNLRSVTISGLSADPLNNAAARGQRQSRNGAAGRSRRAASIAREIFRNSSSGLCARHQKN